MENEAREHLNLAHYNFNRMAVIDEEGNENNEKEEKYEPDIINAGPDIKAIKNMHNTTSGFYPQRFGDRVPTRGDVQSRGARNLIPSAQGGRRGNSRAENSLGR